ncbi:MAG: hypothetical protein RLZZ292_3323 [Bacteroidota bacterium]|jgi:hypothetical protein
MKSFEKWLTQEVEDTFGIVQNYNMSLLNDWLASTSSFTEAESAFIEEIRLEMLYNADFWNEDELKMQFIALLLSIVKYTQTNKYKPFSQRQLSAVIQNIPVNGRVEYMLAQGKQIPKQPFFFLHEYKQETKRNSDPKGQLLISMLTAQTLNEQKFPLYGCFVVGRFWFFVVLENKEYAVSAAFDSSQKDDILKIISILRNIKTIIEKRLAE